MRRERSPWRPAPSDRPVEEGEDRRSLNALTNVPPRHGSTARRPSEATPPRGPKPRSGPRWLPPLQPHEPDAQTAKEGRRLLDPMRQPDAASSSSPAMPGSRKHSSTWRERTSRRAASSAGTRRARGRRLRAEDAGGDRSSIAPISPRRSARLDRTRNSTGASRAFRSRPKPSINASCSGSDRRAKFSDDARQIATTPSAPRSTCPSELAETAGNSSGASAPPSRIQAGDSGSTRASTRRRGLAKCLRAASQLLPRGSLRRRRRPHRPRRHTEPRPPRAARAATAPPGPHTARAGRVRVRRGSPADGR